LEPIGTQHVWQSRERGQSVASGLGALALRCHDGINTGRVFVAAAVVRVRFFGGNYEGGI